MISWFRFRSLQLCRIPTHLSTSISINSLRVSGLGTVLRESVPSLLKFLNTFATQKCTNTIMASQQQSTLVSKLIQVMSLELVRRIAPSFCLVPVPANKAIRLGKTREFTQHLVLLSFLTKPSAFHVAIRMCSLGLVSSLSTQAFMSCCNETLLFHVPLQVMLECPIFRMKARRSLTSFHNALPCHLQMPKSHHSSELLGGDVEHCLGMFI